MRKPKMRHTLETSQSVCGLSFFSLHLRQTPWPDGTEPRPCLRFSGHCSPPFSSFFPPLSREEAQPGDAGGIYGTHARGAQRCPSYLPFFPPYTASRESRRNKRPGPPQAGALRGFESFPLFFPSSVGVPDYPPRGTTLTIERCLFLSPPFPFSLLFEGRMEQKVEAARFPLPFSFLRMSEIFVQGALATLYL